MKLRLLLLSILALFLLVFLLPAAEASSDISVNSTGWWRGDASNFNASDTPIQSALDNATAGEYILVVEPGSYPESLTIKAPGTLDLGDATLEGASLGSVDGITIPDVNGVTITNGTIHGFSVAISTMGTTDDLKLDRLTILSPISRGIYFGSNIDRLIITNVDMENSGSIGIEMSWYINFQDVLIKDTQIIGTKENGMYLGALSMPSTITNITLDNVTMANSGRFGICLESNTEGASLTVKNCKVLNNGMYGLQVSGRGQITVQNNIIEGNGFAGGDDDYYGLVIGGSRMPAYPGNASISFSGNKITDNRNGLYLYQVKDMVVDDSQEITDNWGSPLYIDRSYNVTLKDYAIDATVRNNVWGVRSSDTDNLTLYNLTITGSSGNGILVQGQSDNMLIDSVSIINAGNRGISLGTYGSNITVSNTTIIGALNYGIAWNTFYSTQNLTIKDTLIDGTRQTSGIYIWTSLYGSPLNGLIIENVTTSNSGQRGIDIDLESSGSSNLVVKDSHVLNNSYDGMHIKTNTPIDLQNNVVTGNGFSGGFGQFYGLYLEGIGSPALTFNNNQITGNANGASITGLAGDCYNSTISGTMSDLALASATVNAYNTTFDKSKAYLDNASTLGVYWYLDVLARSNGAPEESVTVTVSNSTGETVYTGMTDASGRISTLTLEEYQKAGTTEADSSPYTLNASKDGVGVSSTTIDLNQSMLVTMDLIPPSSFAFSAPAYTVMEDGDNAAIDDGNIATIEVIRSGDTGKPASVSYATSNGTAIAGVDYMPASGTLDFGIGEAVHSFNVTVRNDHKYTPNKTINLVLSDPVGAVLGVPNTSILTIGEASKPGKLAFNATTYTVPENSTTAAIQVDRLDGSDGEISVDYATINGSALAGVDYQASAGTLNFSDGEVSKTFSVSLINGNWTGSNSSLSLMISNATNGSAITQDSATLAN